MKELQTLKELVNINSVDNCDEIFEYIKNRLKNDVCEIKIIGEKNKCLFIGINTHLKDITPIILSGHIDTVAPNYSLYSNNPFELTITEDKAIGLGVIDMKCFTASIIDNIDKIKEINSPVIFCLTSDEETDILAVEEAIKFLKENNIFPKFTLVGEPTRMNINNSAKSCYSYIVNIYGKSCHSSIIKQGINSIYIASKIALFIEEISLRYPYTTLNVGIIKGGDIVNRVPDFASIEFDVRTLDKQILDNILNELGRKLKELQSEYEGCKVETKCTCCIPPLEEKNEEKIKKLAEKFNLKLERFEAGCEAGYFQAYSGDAILFGTGDINVAHKPDEYLIIKDYFEYNKLLLDILREIEKY